MKEQGIITKLQGFQKVELEDLGNILGSDLSPRLKKAQQVERLAAYLTRKPKQWMAHLMERDIRLLKDLVHAGPDKVQYMDYADYPSLLEVSGLVDFDDSDEQYHKVWLRREVYDIVAPHVDLVIRNGEKSGRFDIERVGLGYLNLYGIIPTERFVDLLTDYYESAIGEDLGSLVRILHQSPLVKLSRYTDRHGDYVCSPCVADIEEIFGLRTEAGLDGSYQAFTHEEAMEAGAGAPYFTVGLKTEEGRALVDMLRYIGYDGFELVKAEHDIWAEAQTPLGNDNLYEPVYRMEQRLTVPVLNDCLAVVADYADSIPKWALNGFSANEKDLLVADCPEYPEDPPSFLAPDAEDIPKWSLPKPTISEGFTDIIEKDGLLERLAPLLPDGFPFGLAIPHVALDDPCPCGSGLHYRHCHGKNLN